MSARGHSPTPAKEASSHQSHDALRVESRRSRPSTITKFLTYFFWVLYVILQFGMAHLYFSRIQHLSRDAELANQEVMSMAKRVRIPHGVEFLEKLEDREFDDQADSMRVYNRFADKWKTLVKNLTQEWGTMNVVSALLIPGLLTMFQIPDTASDPVTRYIAFYSLISAIFSLLFGCFFIVQFTRTHRVVVGIEWALNDNSDTIDTFWNVGVMLSAPAVWLAWSIISFLACMAAFFWRSGINGSAQHHISPGAEHGLRIFLTIIVGWGITFLALCIYTFRFYGRKFMSAYGSSLV